MAIAKKLILTVFNGLGSNTKIYRVAESTNVTMFVPGDEMTLDHVRTCIESGITVVMKRKGR